MPTSRNAKGVDILIYSQDGKDRKTIQVKTLSRRSAVPLGKDLNHLFADYVVICRNVISENPECFVLTPEEVRALAKKADKNGKVTFWLDPPKYDCDEFRGEVGWDRIGSGLAEGDSAKDGVGQSEEEVEHVSRVRGPLGNLTRQECG
jgi:hypothetical protein